MFHDVHIAGPTSGQKNARAIHLRLADNLNAFLVVEADHSDRNSLKLIDTAVARISSGLASPGSRESFQRHLELILEDANAVVFDLKSRSAIAADSLVSATVVLAAGNRLAHASVGRNAVFLTSSKGTNRLAVPETVAARLKSQGLVGGDREDDESLHHATNGLGVLPQSFRIRQLGEIPEPLYYRLLVCSGAVAVSLPVENLEAVYATQVIATPPAHYFYELYRSRRGKGGAVLSVRGTQDEVSPTLRRLELDEPRRPIWPWVTVGISIVALAAALAVLFKGPQQPPQSSRPVPPPPTEFLPEKVTPSNVLTTEWDVAGRPDADEIDVSVTSDDDAVFPDSVEELEDTRSGLPDARPHDDGVPSPQRTPVPGTAPQPSQPQKVLELTPAEPRLPKVETTPSKTDEEDVTNATTEEIQVQVMDFDDEDAAQEPEDDLEPRETPKVEPEETPSTDVPVDKPRNNIPKNDGPEKNPLNTL